MKIITADTKCDECSQPATTIVYFNNKLHCVCSAHVVNLEDAVYKRSEYIVDCPNCRCKFGVN